MVKEHKMNIEETERAFEKCKNDIAMKECYNNTFNMLLHFPNKFNTGEWKVAYGYVSVIDGIMARHSFIVNDKNEVIDVTMFRTSEPYKERNYISHTIFEDSKIYTDALLNEDGQPALYKYFAKKEKQLLAEYMKKGIMLCG